MHNQARSFMDEQAFDEGDNYCVEISNEVYKMPIKHEKIND